MSQRLRWLEVIQLDPNGTYAPKANEKVQVLGGNVTVVTGASTYLYLTDKVVKQISIFFRAPATCASGNYPINPIEVETACLTTAQMSDSRGLWFGPQQTLRYVGNATSYVRVLLEVVKIDPVTGLRYGEVSVSAPAPIPKFEVTHQRMSW